MQRVSHHACPRRTETSRRESVRDLRVAFCIGRRQEPRFVDKLTEIDAATTRPRGVFAGYNDPRIVEKNFNIQVIDGVIVWWHWRQDKIMGSLAQSLTLVGRSGHDVPTQNDAPILFGKPLDHLREHSRRERLGISERQFAGRGIGEKLDVPNPLSQFVESCPAAGKQRASVECGLDAASTSLTPKARSRLETTCDTAGCDTRSSTAALAKLPDCTTANSTRRSRSRRRRPI